MESALNTGDTAWLLTSAALVLLMTPGLAFFYGGMVRVQERPQHADDESSVPVHRRRAVGAVRLLDGLRRLVRAAGLLGNVTQYFGLEGLIDGPDPEAVYPAVRVPRRGFQAMFAIITVGADLRRGRRPDEVRRVDRLRRPVGDPRLLPGRALGLRPGGPTPAAGSSTSYGADRLRRRHRRPHQRRHRRPRAGDRPRQAHRLAEEPDAPAQPAVRHARRRPAVVRLVRLQRRLGPRGEQRGCGRVHQHHRRHVRRDASAGC